MRVRNEEKEGSKSRRRRIGAKEKRKEKKTKQEEDRIIKKKYAEKYKEKALRDRDKELTEASKNSFFFYPFQKPLRHYKQA